MRPSEELRRNAERLRGILSWRAWTDDTALATLHWIERDEYPATALAALVTRAELEAEVVRLRSAVAHLERLPNGARATEQTARLLEEAELQLECHDTQFCQYAPLFPYVTRASG